MLASKHYCHPDLHRDGVAFIELLEAELGQACMNLATIRPLDVAGPGEDISLGEARERWQTLVQEMAASSHESSPAE